MNKKTLYIIIAILMLIPTIVAIVSYNKTNSSGANGKNAVSIQIDDMNGETFLLEKSKDEEEASRMINLILDINSRASDIVALPDAVSGQKCFCVTISTTVKSDSWQYYITPDPSLCYMIAGDGSAHQLTAADGAAFLDSGYAASVYTHAAVPVMTLSNEYSVSPVSAVWKYMNYKGEYAETNVSNIVSEESAPYEVTGGISVAFSLDPDLCTVKITDASGEELFDDDYAKLADFRIDNAADFKVSVNAQWYEDAGRDYYGTIDYSFDAAVSAPATFYVLKAEADPGEFISISAKNAPDISKISFSTEPAINSDPDFYVDGEYTTALFVIPLDTPAGTYTISMGYGGSTQKSELIVNAFPIEDRYISVSSEKVANNYSDAALEEFDSLVNEVTSLASSPRLFEGYFSEGIGSCGQNRGYGRNIVVNDGIVKPYINTGMDYALYSYTDDGVYACNKGLVTYVGETAFTGKVVVLDHGYGLRTWYWNLDSVSVEKGQTVEKDAPLGKCGTTGFCDDGAGVHIAMSVGSVFVNPYDAWINGDGNGILLKGVYELN